MSSFSTALQADARAPAVRTERVRSRASRVLQKIRQVVDGDLIADGQHHQAFDHVFQFADIAGPAISAEVGNQRATAACRFGRSCFCLIFRKSYWTSSGMSSARSRSGGSSSGMTASR